MKRQQSYYAESSEMGTNNRLSGGPEKAEAPKMREDDTANKSMDAEPEKEKRTLASDDYTQKQKIGVCVLYAGTSIAISMCYKTVLSTFHFEAEFLLLACQQILGIVFCLFAQKYLNDYKMVRVPKFDWYTFKQSLPVGTLFVFNIGVGFFGLKMSNVPMFLAIRRTTTIFTLLAEFFILGHTASKRVIASVLVIVIGTIIAGWHTFNTEYLGYFFTICNNILTALYLNMSRKFGDNCGVKGFGLVYYNALVAVPLSLFMSLILGEFEYAANFPDLFKPVRFITQHRCACLGNTMGSSRCRLSLVE
eukprot:gb/GECG01012241.1/.p1 GENE.gb/GECG01012241.1/~~gb/GECG01012241.1/.p1  ORF type:complete len:306 (+),score=25.15 gb/GECG01012241.1/:1-918(+)